MMFKYLLSPQTVPHSPSDDNGGIATAGIATTATVALSATAAAASAMAEEKEDEISQLEVVDDDDDDDDENCQRDIQSPDLPETAPPESIDATSSQVKWSNWLE